jgi:hypothetical protein
MNFSIPLFAPHDVRRSRKIAVRYSLMHEQLKLEVETSERALAKHLDSILSAEKWEAN